MKPDLSLPPIFGFFVAIFACVAVVATAATYGNMATCILLLVLGSIFFAITCAASFLNLRIAEIKDEVAKRDEPHGTEDIALHG
ncbi:MAG: hypothetical protein A2122_00235 [Candidatus Liptonbacteria bacterium GWB1_49_6]|uniref:Uncharacterized protein n=1 Tax=Candidatus Liptonbacteria bacterium GWB1_49_6 TaxID=1798644 RepID=A0A1G2C737_9BACT|nr:MAG: hypothetical protein A2122_00235 [Candidatus Liptonbacteria bacterium GWB1_49_6]